MSVELLKRARAEIRMLRATNAQLGLDAEAYGVIARIVGMIPRQPQPMGEDVVWALNQEIDRLMKPTEDKP